MEIPRGAFCVARGAEDAAFKALEGAFGGKEAILATVAGDDAGCTVVDLDDERIGAMAVIQALRMSGHGFSFAAARRSC